MAIKKGDKIKVEYEGKLEDGQVFDSSKHGDQSHPLEFVVGSGQVIAGFDKEVVGMEKGDEKEFTLKPDQAYGEPNPSLKQKIPKSVFPKDQELKKDMVLIMASPEGQQFPVKVLDIEDESVLVDLNHPLSGKDLTFKIKILDIESKKE